MAAPNVNLTVRDGGLATVPSGTGGLFAKIGPAPLGVVNTVIAVGDQNTIIKNLGGGGLLTEAAALALAVGGQGPVRPSGLLLIPVNPSTYGTASSVTHTGPGTGTVTVTVRPPTVFQIKCILGGATGVATFQTSVDGGLTYGATWTTAATVIIPGVSFTTLAFGAGTAVTGDVITVSVTTGAGTLTSGSGTLAVTHSASCPVDAYTVVTTIILAGGLGVGMFTYSLDNGVTTSAPVLIPGSGVYAVPDGTDLNKSGTNQTGVVLTFSGTFTLADTYAFTTTTASYTGTDLTNAFNVLVADTRWGSGVGLHIVGPAATVGAANTLLATLDTLMATGVSTYYKFDGAMIEVPSDTDANIIAAFAAASSLRVGACAGFEKQTSPLNGRVQSRPSAWQVMARAGCVNPAEDLGQVSTGSLVGVISLVRDEATTPGLDAARFSTLTSIIGRNGFYITNGRLMSQPGSDFTYWQYRRVMDVVSSLTRQSLLTFLNSSVRVNSDGSIVEKDARKIEQSVINFIFSGLPPGSITDLQVTVNRSNNVLSSQTILPTVRVLPLGYAKFINADIGFTNQALQIKAA